MNPCESVFIVVEYTYTLAKCGISRKKKVQSFKRLRMCVKETAHIHARTIFLSTLFYKTQLEQVYMRPWYSPLTLLVVSIEIWL